MGLLTNASLTRFFDNFQASSIETNVVVVAILVAAVATGAYYNVNVASAQSTNTTKSTPGPNMIKTMNMTTSGGNITKK
jgi:Tfp pilus assembly major pilin PilA